MRLNPFDALIWSSLQAYLSRDAARHPEAKATSRALPILCALYAIGMLLISAGLLGAGRLGYVAYGLAKPVTVDRQGDLRPGRPGDQPSPHPGVVLTPEQKLAQSHQNAYEQISTETGFSTALMSQFFKSPEELAKLGFVKDLREQFVVDVAEERYLLSLLSAMQQRLDMLSISQGTYHYLIGKIDGLGERIPGDVQNGGPFADRELRAMRTRILENSKPPTIPQFDTRPITEAVRAAKPIRRLDLVKLIVVLRASNQAIRDIEAAHKPLKDFIDRLPAEIRSATFTERATTSDQQARQRYEREMRGIYAPENLNAARSVQGPKLQFGDRNIEPQTNAFENDPGKVYGLLKSTLDQGVTFGAREVIEKMKAGDPELARLWSYSRYGIFAPFVLNGLGIQKVITEQEDAAQNLERFLGVPSPAAANVPAAAQAIEPANLDAVFKGLPLRAPAPNLRLSTRDLAAAGNRLRVLEEQRWIPTIRDTLSNLVGEDRAVISLEGLAGSWLLTRSSLQPGDGALPLTIVDGDLVRLLRYTPPEANPFGYFGEEKRVLEYPELLSGRWVMVFEDTGVLGRPKVVGIRRIE